MKQPALFLDRDGVINEEVGYLHRQEDVRFVPGIFSLMSKAQAAGYRLVVITNQAGIGRGMYGEDDFKKLMTWMRDEFAAQSIVLDGIYHCPHHPELGLGDYLRECFDRKPSPGMLLRAARDLDLDLPNSALVGDRMSDIEAGHTAGVKRLYLFDPTRIREDDVAFTYRRVTRMAEVEEALGLSPSP